MKKVKGPTPESTQALSEQERQRQQGVINTTQQALNPYLPGSEGMSQFRQGLASQAASANATAGGNALARIREKAQAMGFANQPITYGAEAGLQNEQAARAAQIPFQVQEAAAPLELQAAGQEQNLARLYDPEAYYGLAANQAEQARNRRAALWGTVAAGATSLIKPRV